MIEGIESEIDKVRIIEVNSIAEYKTDHPSRKYLPGVDNTNSTKLSSGAKILSFPDGIPINNTREIPKLGTLAWVRELLSRFHKQQDTPPEKKD
jgi:hypothetical protein